MKFKLLNNEGQKTYAVVLDSGDSVMDCLNEFAKSQQLHAAAFTAIGAFSEATVGFFNFSKKDYTKISVPQQTEVLTMTGDISLYKNTPKIHAHVVLGKEDGATVGGHLIKAIAHPTLEIILTEAPAWLEREMDEESGIPLIAIEP